MVQWDGVRLKDPTNMNLNRKDYAVAGIIPGAKTETALTAEERLYRDPQLWFEAPLKRGHLQFLINQK